MTWKPDTGNLIGLKLVQIHLLFQLGLHHGYFIFEGLDHGFLLETKLLELIGNRHEMLDLSTGLHINGLGQAP